MNRRALAVLAAGLVAAILGAPMSPAPAAAADGEILVSQDGTTWSTTLGSSVFDTSRRLVPGDHLQGSFYVKNDHGFPAYLRVGLSALSVTHWSLAEAVSLTTLGTGAGGASGSAAALSGDGVVCADLLRRDDPVPPGGIVLISADLVFRETTSGRSAQGEIAQIGFIVEFSEVDLNAFSQPLCNNTARIGPPDPNLGSPSPSTPGPGTTTPPAAGGGPGGGSALPAPDAGDGIATESETAGAPGNANSAFERPAASGTIEIEGPIGLDPAFFTTVRWWEEYAILVLVAAALLGMLLRVAADGRRDESREGRA